jgi:hypothetical protein
MHGASVPEVAQRRGVVMPHVTRLLAASSPNVLAPSIAIGLPCKTGVATRERMFVSACVSDAFALQHQRRRGNVTP